jgi:hypothetical protein
VSNSPMEHPGFGRLVTLLKAATSALVVAFGFFTGILGVAIFANLAVFFPHVIEPGWPRVAVTFMLGFIPLIASVLALRRRRQAGLLFLVAAPILATCSVLGNSEPHLIDTGVSLLFLVPGAFWLITSRAAWPQLISVRLTPGNRVYRPALLDSLLFGMLAVTGILGSICSPMDVPEGGCGPNMLITVHRFADPEVFTARVVLVGRSFGLPPGYSCWSVAHVQRRFPGLASPISDFVVLRFFFKHGERGEYLVDGRRGPGLLGRVLPIIEVYRCCHTQPLDQATVDLRALLDGPPKSGVRIIGRVYTPGTGGSASGVRLVVSGPGGSITTATDQQGIYDLVGLQAGHYSVQLESKMQCSYCYIPEADVKSGEVWEPQMR